MVLLLATAWLAACSAGTSDPATGLADAAPTTQDAATRASPVVPGRRARVFIFAGVDEHCRPVAAPHVAVSSPPAKGEIALVVGQLTTIGASARGTCIGSAATGTAVYYTAHDGTSGSDRFTVSARSANGEAMTRNFAVRIEP